MITIQDFMNTELIVAEVKEAKEHPDADRLLVLKVDTGKGERQLVAGIRKSYEPDQLVGKQIIMVANLEPAMIRGEVSEGMCLAASDEDGISLLRPEKVMAIGSRVK